MSSVAERNQFRRLIGDFGKDAVADSELEQYLDDATEELTADFQPAPVTDFDTLVVQYHPEVVYKAAINWWWQKWANLTDKHSISAGGSTQNVGEKWDRVLQVIQQLEEKFNEIQTLGIDIDIGNLSRWDRSSLQRFGGTREEDKLE